MSYRAPIEEFKFLFDNIVGLENIAKNERFAEATDDVVSAILTEAGKLCEDVLSPLQRTGDLEPARLENGVVRTSPGFAEGYRAVAESGWVSIAADPAYGGMGLPMVVTNAVNEMIASACLSLQLNPLMTQGQIDALEHHASEEIKALYLPKLVSGEWNGTMNLTEAHAGSDVGSLRTKAEPNGDGTYAITGQKIFISWGDNDFTENVVHLVLARLPDAGPGTKGISLFLVPKFIPDENGNPGVANTLKVVSLEHKLGLHGSPTAVMQYDSATGWLVGEENGGMRAMFTMMNNARLGVASQGVAVAESAMQHAARYAADRTQGRAQLENPTGTILDHADVRRMLATMKAQTFAARAISSACAAAIDMEKATGTKEWTERAALLTPISKGFGTEAGIQVADYGIQVHGGMGYVEETGAAQYARDVRVTAIYEGTTGIQAMDLVGRKLANNGDAVHALLDEVEANAERARAPFPELAEPVWQASEALREATEWMVKQDNPNARFAGSVPYLRAFAHVLGGHFHLMAAMAEGEDGPRNRLAHFYIKRLLPEAYAHIAHATAGDSDLYAMPAEDFAA